MNARERPADGQADGINAIAEAVVTSDVAGLVVDGLGFEDTFTTDGSQQLPIGSFDEGLAVALNARERPADSQSESISANGFRG